MDPVFNSSPGQRNVHSPVAPSPAPAPGPSASSNKPLWAAVGVLGVAVAALGGTLLWQNVHGDQGSATPVQAAGALPGGQALGREDVLSERPAAAASAAPSTAAVPAAAVAAAPAPAPARPVVTAPSGTSAPRYEGKGYTGSYAAQPAVSRAVCAECGRIESVTPVQQAAPASGIGAVAGGVLGAVLGNQVGGGSGRTAATLLGAGGGAYLGHNVEKRTRTTTTYQVRVRMDDGSVRTFNRSSAPAVGQPVTVQGSSYTLGQGRSYSTQSAQDPYYQTVSEPQGSYSSNRY